MKIERNIQAGYWANIMLYDIFARKTPIRNWMLKVFQKEFQF